MSARLRRLLAALCVLALLGAAAPAYSSSQTMTTMMEGGDPVSVTVDVLLLRPIGLVTLVGGIGLFAASLPLVAIVRPHEIGKPFNQLIVQPAKYVWADPLGQH